MLIYIYYFFAAVLVWFSYRSFTGGISYLRFFRQELAKPPSSFTPFSTVIAPCRGIDDGMENNLLALLEQDYPDYEVIFVVDDTADPAYTLIRQIQRQKDCKLVVAPKATASSQKVENLREAVLHADERSKAFVFVDSDVRVGREWLRSLVAPLESDTTGAATGYRWFISNTGNLGSELRSAWNASIASALGSNTGSNFCWGGSMAIRRDVFDRVRMRDAWDGTLSDDFAVTRTMRAAGLPIHFVPQALSASLDDCSVPEMLEFTTRQMKITRTYATPLWVLSFFGSALFCSVMLAGLMIVIFSRANTFDVLLSTCVLFTVTVFSTLKAWLRLDAVRLVLPQFADQLRRRSFTQYTLWLVTPPIFLLNSIAALLSRRMTWRGTTYELKSASETVIIRG